MHILMVAPQPFFRPRGTPFSVLHRLRALSQLGHAVDLVTYPFGESPVIPGLRIHRSRRPPLVEDVGIGPSLSKLILDAPLFHLAWRLAATQRFDFVHTHEEAGWLGAAIRRRAGLPHLYDMHSSLPQQFDNFGRFDWRPVRALFQRLEKFTLAGSDAVIAICPELRDHVLASGYTRPVELIENTLDYAIPPRDSQAEAQLRSDLRLGTSQMVLYTGTLEAYQGLDLLLAAAPAVLRERPRTVFVIVGGTAEQGNALRARAELLGVDAAFRFVPAVPPAEVFLFHRICDVLITTRSRGTNTPLKIYQYLRAGKPIVATAIRSHTQVLDGASAELVAPGAAEVAAGLIRVLDDPVHAQSLAAGAARLARDRFGEQAYMRSLERILAALRTMPARPSV